MRKIKKIENYNIKKLENYIIKRLKDEKIKDERKEVGTLLSDHPQQKKVILVVPP